MSEPVCTQSDLAADDGFDVVTGPGDLWEHPAVTAARADTAMPSWWPLAAALVMVAAVVVSVYRPLQWWAA